MKIIGFIFLFLPENLNTRVFKILREISIGKVTERFTKLLPPVRFLSNNDAIPSTVDYPKAHACNHLLLVYLDVDARGVHRDLNAVQHSRHIRIIRGCKRVTFHVTRVP